MVKHFNRRNQQWWSQYRWPRNFFHGDLSWFFPGGVAGKQNLSWNLFSSAYPRLIIEKTTFSTATFLWRFIISLLVCRSAFSCLKLKFSRGKCTVSVFCGQVFNLTADVWVLTKMIWNAFCLCFLAFSVMYDEIFKYINANPEAKGVPFRKTKKNWSCWGWLGPRPSISIRTQLGWGPKHRHCKWAAIQVLHSFNVNHRYDWYDHQCNFFANRWTSYMEFLPHLYLSKPAWSTVDSWQDRTSICRVRVFRNQSG